MPQELIVEIPRLHHGQQAIVDRASRFNVVRCGRRFGKTTMLVAIAGKAAAWGKRVGVFSADYKLLLEVWDELKAILEPITRRVREQHHRLDLITGGLVEGWTLDGEDPGRSRKYDLVLIDEAGLVKDLKRRWRLAIRPTLIDLRGGAWFFGTSKVGVRFFNDLFRLGKAGRNNWRSFNATTRDNPFITPEELDELASEMTDEEYRQEILGEDVDASTAFFPQPLIERCIDDHARRPDWIGRIDVPVEFAVDRDYLLTHRKLERIKLTADGAGDWRLWTKVRKDFQGLIRPDQDKTYVIGADVGQGVGSSNSTMSVVETETMRKVGSFASAKWGPEELARLAMAAALWWGGSNRVATICPEVNGGAGEAFVKALLGLGFGELYRDKSEAVKTSKKTQKRYGWWNSPKAKWALFSDYRAALQSGRFINQDEQALNECIAYIVDEKGRVVTAEDDEGDGITGARIPHGDRVVADACAYLAAQRENVSVPDQPDPPPHSPAWRERRSRREGRRSRRRAA